MITFSIWRHLGAGPLRPSATPIAALARGPAGLWAAAGASYATRGPITSLLQAVTGLFDRPDPQYATHVPLTRLQKGALALLSAAGAAADPRRADLVAAVGETTGLAALRGMRDRMAASENGRAVLAERPHVTCESMGRAWELAPHTFGGAYARFMGDRNFRADDRPPVRFVDDAELAYVAARAREVHDFWHVLFACHTNVFGEVALKAVEFMQTGLPMTALAVAAGEARLGASDRAVLNGTYLPWAVRAGARSADLMCIYYERHLEEDLEVLRQRWRITPAPQARQNVRRQGAKKLLEGASPQAPAEPSHTAA